MPSRSRSPTSSRRPSPPSRLAAWLDLFDDEDVSVGPVATLEEAAARLRG
jgi:hypothetical protein